MDELLRKHAAAIDAICDALYEHGVSAQDGEAILLWIAGLSAGFRQAPIADTAWLASAVIAWQEGASTELRP
jgi:hypothetical protein